MGSGGVSVRQGSAALMLEIRGCWQRGLQRGGGTSKDSLENTPKGVGGGEGGVRGAPQVITANTEIIPTRENRMQPLRVKSTI